MEQAGRTSDNVRILLYVTIGTCAVVVPLVMPLLVTATATLFGISADRASGIAVAEMTGSGVGALVASAMLGRWRARHAALAGFLVVAVVNLATPQLATFTWAPVLRLASGIGAGICLGIATAGLASLRNAERNLAIFFVAAFGLSALALRVLPPWIDQRGPGALFPALATAAVVGLAVSAILPSRGSNATDERGPAPPHVPASRVQWPGALLGVTTILLFFMGVGATWTFYSQIGIEAALGADAIGSALGLAAVAGGAGALAAVFVAGRLPRSVWLALGFVAVIGGLVTLMSGVTVGTYTAAAVCLLFSWNFTFPFMLGLLGEADPRGRLVPIGVAMSSFGFAIGPALAGFMLAAQVTERVPRMGMVLVVIAAAMVVVASRNVGSTVRQSRP